MRPSIHATLVALSATACLTLLAATEDTSADGKMLQGIYTAALTTSPAYEHLRELTTQFPGRLSGSKHLEGAILWAKATLEQTGVDRLEVQPVMVPHWERGAAESVQLLPHAAGSAAVNLTAVALGGSVPTPAGGLHAPVVELHSLDELKTTDVKGKIVFFNRPMNPVYLSTFHAYGEAGDQRNRGPGEAAKYGAVGAVVRSLTLSLDDVPHTGNTGYPPGAPRIPAAALSTIAAARLSAALKADPATELAMQIHSQWFDDAPSANVIGEIKGSEHPEQIILIGGHLDSWDIAPGAHDDGAGVVQSIKVLRLLKAAGYQPRHTVRCVLFTSEENSLNGAVEYARIAGEKHEEHLLALESDGGGFQPHGIQLGNTRGTAHTRAARWLPLLEPYGITRFENGSGGADVSPLMAKGFTVGEILPDSQRYFDYHHTAIDSLDKVNKRELEIGAATMAALVYLVDQHGL